MVESYPELYETFRWHVPRGFNLANACCFQWSGLPGHEQRPALIYKNRLGHTDMTTFAELGRLSAQLASGLTRLGVIPGDRVVIVMSTPSDLLTAMLACWAIRAVAVPLPPGRSSDVLLPRMKQARSQIALIDSSNQAEALAAISKCPRIKHVVGIDVYDGRVMSWRGLIARQPDKYTPSECLPSDPALMVWPEHQGPDLDPQAALVLAHQSLIGQLPGFVMAGNWFPDQAKQLLTTLKPWHEDGLLAAVLPALYFGHSVVLADRLPAAANIPSAVTHAVTTGASLIEAIKLDGIGLSAANALTGLTVLDHALDEQWRASASDLYGCAPNLASFISGCGLMIAQCQTKWPEPSASSGKVVPGHQLRLAQATAVPVKDPSPTETLPACGELQVCRVDAFGQTDPAQFVQSWPFKDMLDLSSELPAWWRPGLFAQDLGDGGWRVLGHEHQWKMFAKQPITLWQLEQAVLLERAIQWVEVAFVTSKKSQPDEIEIWVMVDTGPTHERQLKPWREALRSQIIDRILASSGLAREHTKIRVGLVDRQAMVTTMQSGRSPWHTRAYQALIDFL